MHFNGGVVHLFLLYKTGCITKSLLNPCLNPYTLRCNLHFAASALSTAAPYSAKEISTLESMWERVPTSGRCRLLVDEDWLMIQSLVNDFSTFYIQEITFFDATKNAEQKVSATLNTLIYTKYFNAQDHTFPMTKPL